MKKPTTLARLAVAAIAALTLAGAAGCSLGNAVHHQRAERHMYMIEPVREPQPSASHGKSVLKVRTFAVSPGFDTREFVYKFENQRFESDYYNLFFMMPAAAATDATRKWLGASGLFGHVVDATSQAEETYSLEANLAAIYGNFENPAAPKAVLELQFFLLKDAKTTSTVVFQKNYRQETPLSGPEPQILASGLQTNLKTILTALEADLKGVVK